MPTTKAPPMFYVHPSTRQPLPNGETNWGVWAAASRSSDAPPVCVSDGFHTREAAQREADRLNGYPTHDATTEEAHQ